MYSNCNTSTPKRRRLGTGNILRSAFLNIQRSRDEDCPNNDSIPNSPSAADVQTNEFLPCNQVEYLSDSGNNSSMCSVVPASPNILNSSGKLQNWEPTRITNIKNNDTSILSTGLQQEIENISDDMFLSRLEMESKPDNHDQSMTKSKGFRQQIEESFELINDSICKGNFDDRNEMFETKDSFLLDIKESDIIIENKENNKDLLKPVNYEINHKKEGFYGLPKVTKELFKTYRNIEKLYEWQEECLNLNAIKEHRNLIYALPTSGGKTLVAEVLMLREVLCHKKNTLFILPFVAIVQEKIWGLTPFALQLDFLVEEYAGGKGHIPPKTRRKKHSIYIATIEKGLALVRSLIELDRLHEIGLIVVDELHLIGEPGRGGTLETLLTTVIFANKGIQIVGMSATIGNLPSLAKFLGADVYKRDFRPVELTEYVKLGDMLHRILWKEDGVEFVPEKTVESSGKGESLDVDGVRGLVAGGGGRAGGAGGVLVFCATKRNCENVAAMLAANADKHTLSAHADERLSLSRALLAEGASAALAGGVRAGVAFHHAGIGNDERALLEHAYRSGVISTLCCTSTLAAGVNLPARRVIIRAPRQGREFLSLAVYRQMVGRAGRAGCCTAGESIIICPAGDWERLRGVFSAGLLPVRSCLSQPVCAEGLLLSAAALGLADSRRGMRRLLGYTMFAVDEDSTAVKQLCDTTLRSLLHAGALEPVHKQTDKPTDEQSHIHVQSRNIYLYDDSEIRVSALGNAAIKGCMDLSTARQFLSDIDASSYSMVPGALHLLYIITPHDAAAVQPDYTLYYQLYCNLDHEGIQTAKTLGITEVNAIRMMTGKPITNIPELVLRRFYLALVLRDLWRQTPIHHVANKYQLPRGTVQSLLSTACSFAASCHKLCCASERAWWWAALLGELAARLQHCAAPGLDAIMELPNVRKARAMQLLKAGYKSVEQLAKASAEDLCCSISHLTRTAAQHLISAARMALIEKVENLRAEAEDVMMELNM